MADEQTTEPSMTELEQQRAQNALDKARIDLQINKITLDVVKEVKAAISTAGVTTMTSKFQQLQGRLPQGIVKEHIAFVLNILSNAGNVIDKEIVDMTNAIGAAENTLTTSPAPTPAASN